MTSCVKFHLTVCFCDRDVTDRILQMKQDMNRQFLRLLWLYQQAVRGTSPSREDLAKRWDVDVRTAYRYHATVKDLLTVLDNKDFDLSDSVMRRIQRKTKRQRRVQPNSG